MTAESKAATSSSLVMSAANGTAPLSAPSASSRSARRATANTFQPSAVRALTVASPIPVLAPVTTAVFVCTSSVMAPP
ncbi:hypothetical protein AHiyo8_60450 [Arthrobacter sp. Hiyo8]|nr:hypothetical protein AHiyo8_60450 [Arthrobacter sp. Hiyo8]